MKRKFKYATIFTAWSIVLFRLGIYVYHKGSSKRFYGMDIFSERQSNDVINVLKNITNHIATRAYDGRDFLKDVSDFMHLLKHMLK